MKILGATIGDCVHTAGILGFLEYAKNFGHTCIFAGTRKSVADLITLIEIEKPDMVALSYRLTPQPVKKIFEQLKKEKSKNQWLKKVTLAFGGTESVCTVARTYGIFDFVVSQQKGMRELAAFLSGIKQDDVKNIYPQNLVERIEKHYPYPLLRHHFGLPSLIETIKGAKIIAESQMLDILSIGPDQNAQEYFFNPEKMNPEQNGAGGVPIRKPEHLEKIYKATRCGNYPLVRCYAGTNNLLKWAKMTVKTINNAWGAIPLFWYSTLDTRSKRQLKKAIQENQNVIRWYAEKGIPVEINDSHQWGLRHAPDSIEVATAFIAAYNAKKAGVKHYIFQYMFNTPYGISPSNDLAKMLAKKEMIENLMDEHFAIYTMVRAGLASLSSDPYIAKGQLAASVTLSMALKPHIVHVVGFSEGDHCATAEEIIESCKIVHGLLKNIMNDWPEFQIDSRLVARKNKLIKDANIIIEAIRQLSAHSDGLIDPDILSKAVETGILDAPDLKGNKHAKGIINTRILNGACYTIDEKTGKILEECERINRIMSEL
ncbi:MAG TPA: cobalamin-dependent protein [bacterium]|nr:cobalamin-dependent protein [bacterium]HOL35249.1 cobalamin-dependent protein [bacterium]HPP08679.1 cobalamin-dependent protein [bacterium]